MVGKGDLGEVSVGVEEWFSVGAGGGASEFRFNAEGNFVCFFSSPPLSFFRSFCLC